MRADQRNGVIGWMTLLACGWAGVAHSAAAAERQRHAAGDLVVLAHREEHVGLGVLAGRGRPPLLLQGGAGRGEQVLLLLGDDDLDGRRRWDAGHGLGLSGRRSALGAPHATPGVARREGVGLGFLP